MVKTVVHLEDMRSNYQQKKLNASIYNEEQRVNQLQQRLFKELEDLALLKVSAIGASVNIYHNDQVLARMVCLDRDKAEKILEYMQMFFIEHKLPMSATVTQVEFL